LAENKKVEEEMKEKILTYCISLFMSMLSPDMLKGFMDNVLDFIEDKVAGTASDVDDRLVLPLVEMIRSAFDIPDND
jgi:hypothetical protein